MRLSHVRAGVPLLLALSAGTASAATFDVSGFGTAGFVISIMGRSLKIDVPNLENSS